MNHHHGSRTLAQDSDSDRDPFRLFLVTQPGCLSKILSYENIIDPETNLQP
jgi:hypothetical protein